MGLVTDNKSNFGFYVYSQVVNDPVNHRYRVDSQAVLKIISIGMTTVTTDWVAIVVEGVSHKVYLGAWNLGVGSHYLYRRSDYFDYSSAARTVTVNANGMIFGRRNPITGRNNGPGQCTGYANYETLPAKYAITNIDLVKGATDHDSMVASCTGIVANRGYDKTIRWWIDGSYKGEEHLSQEQGSAGFTFTGLAPNTAYTVTARVYYRYNGVTSYGTELQAKAEVWSTAQTTASGGVCDISEISKVSAKISLAGVTRNLPFNITAKVYLKTTLKTTVTLNTSTTGLEYTFINLEPGTAYTAHIELFNGVGTLLKTYPAIAFTTQQLEMFLLEDAVLTVTKPALGSIKFALSNIKRNIPFGLKIEYVLGEVTHVQKMPVALTPTVNEYTFTGLPVYEDELVYNITIYNDGEGDELQLLTGDVVPPYIILDYGDGVKSKISRHTYDVTISDILFETVPEGLPCVLTLDAVGVSSFDENIICCDMKDTPVIDGSVVLHITNTDYNEDVYFEDFVWRANGLSQGEDWFYANGIWPAVSYYTPPEILDLSQTGLTAYVSDARAKYWPDYAELEEMDPEDYDPVNEDAFVPAVVDIMWHVKVYDADWNLVKYTKVGPEHEPVFTNIITGLKPNTLYTLALEYATVCRAYNYLVESDSSLDEVEFTTESYLMTSGTLVTRRNEPLSITFEVKDLMGNSEFPIKLQIYAGTGVKTYRMTTEEFMINPLTKTTAWSFVEGLGKNQVGTGWVEVIECVTNTIIHTFEQEVGTWTDPYLGWLLLRNYKWYRMAHVGLTFGADSVPRKNVFPELRYKIYFRPSQIDPTYPRRFLFERTSESDTEYLPYTSYETGPLEKWQMTEAYLPDENGYVIINKQNFPALGAYCWKPVQMFIYDPETNELIISTRDLAYSEGAALSPSNIGPDEGEAIIPEVAPL